jgi:hypothetical protein
LSRYLFKGEVKMLDFTERPERTEARAIMHLVCVGAVTLDEARELISIPEREEQVLRMFVAVAGKDGIPIRSALVFRQKVMVEFEKLVALGQTDLSAAA